MNRVRIRILRITAHFMLIISDMRKTVETLLSPSELNPDPFKSQKLFQIHDAEYLSIQVNQNEITFSFVLKFLVFVPVATNANGLTVPCRTCK